MKITAALLLLFSASLLFCACQPAKKPKQKPEEPTTLVQLQTTKGDILLELYDETPLHRDNFIDIIEEGVLDSVLFHRVIENFMIQGGDPDSKKAPPGVVLGNGDLDYKVFAEFHPNLFHKKGALAAARDGNPDRASSSTQFYIVQGKVFNDSTLALAEDRINNWLAQHHVKHQAENKSLLDSLQSALVHEDMKKFALYNDSLNQKARTFTDFESYRIPEAHRNFYKTIGGAPHLDQNYTVFGEVLRGLDVVDSIAAVETDNYDRPTEDVRILKAQVIRPQGN